MEKTTDMTGKATKGKKTEMATKAKSDTALEEKTRTTAGNTAGARKPETICISNQKGGVGKSTLTVNLAYELARRGRSVLLVDLDQQGTLSMWCYDEEGRRIKDRAEEDGKSIACVLIPSELGLAARVGLEDVTYPTRWDGVDIVPASSALYRCTESTCRNPASLRKAIEESGTVYDFVLLDTPATLDVKTTCAFAAADWTLVPVECDETMMDGLQDTLDGLAGVAMDMWLPEPKWKVVVNKVAGSRTRADEDGVAQLLSTWPADNIIATPVRFTKAISDRMHPGQVLAEYVKSWQSAANVAEDLSEVTDAVLAWVEGEERA